jgi:hypothetical protein
MWFNIRRSKLLFTYPLLFCYIIVSIISVIKVRFKFSKENSSEIINKWTYYQWMISARCEHCTQQYYKGMLWMYKPWCMKIWCHGHKKLQEHELNQGDNKENESQEMQT